MGDRPVDRGPLEDGVDDSVQGGWEGALSPEPFVLVLIELEEKGNGVVVREGEEVNGGGPAKCRVCPGVD